MLSNGTKLERKTHTSTGVGDVKQYTWYEVGKIVNLTPPAMARDAIEITHYGSQTKEFLAGFRDGGELTAEFLLEDSALATDSSVSYPYVDTSGHQKLVYSDFATGEKATYRISFSDAGKNWEFPCLVTGLSAVTPLNDKMTLSATLKVVGAPAYVSVV